MTLTNCPRCQRRCFTDAIECEQCGLVFPPGILNKKAQAKEKDFLVNSYLLFASLLTIVAGALLLLQIYDYRNGVGLFGSLTIR
jgi:hypothetical protein